MRNFNDDYMQPKNTSELKLKSRNSFLQKVLMIKVFLLFFANPWTVHLELRGRRSSGADCLFGA